jgi:thiamine-monophosphate kinase
VPHRRSCRVSHVSAAVKARDLPLSDAAQTVLSSEPAELETIVSGGDDYEILCAVPTAKLGSFESAAAAANVQLTQIGEIAKGEGAIIIGPDGKPMALARPSYSHF